MAWSQTVMHHRGGEKAQSGMTVFFVIPGEKLLAEATAILDRAKAFGEIGPVLQGRKWLSE